MKTIIEQQKELCDRYGTPYVESPLILKVGVARNVQSGLLPINGLRHQPEGDTTGWYIWAGEDLSEDPDFFVPLHVEHLNQWCPAVLPYLGLAPRWRFLIASAYEDVWADESLLIEPAL
ncbi:MAG: immunity protein Imm33 domain-containing protein [Armatimonadota bacterium]